MAYDYQSKHPPPMAGQWQNGLFGCFNNMGICLMTFCCPCVTAGKNAEAMGEDCLLCGCMACCCWGVWLAANTVIRGKIRKQQGIEGSLTMDIILLLFCGQCTLCQEAQELEYMEAMQAGPPRGGYPPPSHHMEMRRH